MGPIQTVLIISDFPIVAATAEGVFRDSHRVVVQKWAAYLAHPWPEAELAVVDVTSMDPDIALSLLKRTLPGARIAICSLHRNEIKVFRTQKEGFVAEAELPSLLALTA